ncbi:pyridoxamine 5'-phosphate oxidase family protein [Microbacterium stercoris]|uniref:Pyridoxamine 5'-phosphate oxidase family protein n=1 Tax=Microbacterium stercoris TaxID=2820289 RepID=A0A939TQW9_9MICO|nr:pyridoxamine 5'-phosphate oxidase family protein [Microbacterium stercoris]MBO3663900.1 pyridoxamine 5'-phosphate oxidase family protein [Microbacterium stercoris]
MIDWNDVAPKFAGTAVAHLATVGRDGGPRSVPLWVDVVDETDLAFFTEAGAAKDKNIGHEPRVALSVTDPANPLDMATVRGEVTARLEGEAALVLVDRIAVKYTGEPYGVRTGLVAFVVRPTSWWAHDYAG